MHEILHIDMDAFYVSVEELENPSLRGRAVIVGADPEGRGVVTAASYEARKFGVHSAQPIRVAKRLCPHAVFLRGRYEKYRQYSEAIYGIFNEVAPGVEMVSIDEAYLDLTGCDRLHGSLIGAADLLIRRVKRVTGLNCSVGASTSYLVSKIASDQAKPHGLLYVLPGCEATFLAPLPLRRMPGIGRVLEGRLHALGLNYIGDIQRAQGQRLKCLGKLGGWLYSRSLGLEEHSEHGPDGSRSISHETTFELDTADRGDIERTLSYLSQRVGRRLRENRLFASVVGLKLRYSDFRTITRDLTLREPTRLDSTIYKAVRRLFAEAWKPDRKVRLLGVHASKLEPAVLQPSLIDARQHEKLGQLLATADSLRDRFGFDTLQMARSIEPPKPKQSKK
jgi:DNA polymerase-4